MISRRFLRKWVLPGACEAFQLLSSLLILAPLAIIFLGSFKDTKEAAQLSLSLPTVWHPENYQVCLLYTSDAADDLLCVDLGGRRIIKKKNTKKKYK